MRIEYERIDFAKGTSTRVVREIDTKEVLKGNALFQKLSREPKPKPEVEVCMSDPIFLEGHEFRDGEGKLICRVARDIFPGEAPSRDQFKDWQIPEPIVGEILPRSIAKALLS